MYLESLEQKASLKLGGTGCGRDAWENFHHLCGRWSALAGVSVNQSDDQVSFISCLLCPVAVRPVSAHNALN